MSVLYCMIPYFAASLVQRDDSALQERPLVLIGPEGRVFGVSAAAASCGIVVDMTARQAEIRCPEARLLDVDLAHSHVDDRNVKINTSEIALHIGAWLDRTSTSAGNG